MSGIDEGMRTISQKPLPCPFCGNDDIRFAIVEDTSDGYTAEPRVFCTNCGSGFHLEWQRADELGDCVTEDQKAELFGMWNRRVGGQCENDAPRANNTPWRFKEFVQTANKRHSETVDHIEYLFSIIDSKGDVVFGETLRSDYCMSDYIDAKRRNMKAIVEAVNGFSPDFVDAFKSLCQSMSESLAADRKHWGCIGCKDCDVTSTCKGAKWHRDMERAEKCLKQYADCNVWSAD